jgi:anti-sigma B factor antagonist
MELDIKTKSKEDIHILDVRGEIDLYSSKMLRDYIFTTIKQRHPRTVIVELSDVSYIDSSGIATLVEGLQLAKEYDTRFKLAGLSRIVLEVFQLVRLERVFDIYPNEEEALKSEKSKVKNEK